MGTVMQHPQSALKFLAFFLPWVALTTMPVFASGSGDAGLFSMSLEQLLKVKVTSASKQKQALQQAPASMTVFSQRDFEQFGVTTLEELLNYVSGVEYHREGLTSQVSFRGRRSLGNDVLVLLDGIRLNDPVSASAFTSFLTISLSFIEKVEVIKGPGSALYGSNAYNGVISLTSRKNVDELSISTGRYNHRNAQLAYHQIGQDWQLNLNAERFIDNGQGYPAFFDFFGEKNPTQDPQSGSHINLMGHYKNWFGQIGQHQRLNEDFAWSSQGNGINHYDLDSRFARFGYDTIYSDVLEFQLALEQVDSKQSTVLVQMPAHIAATAIWSNGEERPFIGGNYAVVRSQRFTLDSSWQQNPNSLWHIGLEVRKERNDEITFQGNWDPDINRESLGFVFVPKDGPYTRELWWFGSYQPLVPESDRQIKSVYLQNSLKWQEQWELTLGAHFDDYDDVGNNLSLRGGMVYQYTPETTFKLLYGQAFRAPTLYELYALISTGLIGNPKLTPETVDTLDVIWLQDWGKVQSSLTWYHSKFDDVIDVVLVDDIISGFASFQPQNLDSQDLSGWEFDLSGQLNNNWSTRLSYARGNEFVALGAAQQNASLEFNYQHKRWNINLSGIWHSSVLSREVSDTQPNAIHLGSYWLLKTHLVHSLSETLELSLTINNLLDKDYLGYNPANGAEQGSPHRGRHWLLSARWGF